MNRASFRPMVEVLEGRCVPTGTPLAYVKNGILEIPCTNAVDKIAVIENVESGKTTVIHNGNHQVFPTAKFNRVRANTLNGNDLFDGSELKTRPAIVNGGNGNDTLIGGGQCDQLIGGWGNDLMIGNRGKDYMAGQWGLDTYISGKDVIVDGPSIVHFDPNDGPAYVYAPPPVTPPQDYIPGAGHTTVSFGSPAGVTTLPATVSDAKLVFDGLAYTPEFAGATYYAFQISGTGGTNLELYVSAPNQTDSATTFVPTTVYQNSNGTRTLVFNTPIVQPQQSAIRFQLLVHGTGPIDITGNWLEASGGGGALVGQYLQKVIYV